MGFVQNEVYNKGPNMYTGHKANEAHHKGLAVRPMDIPVEKLKTNMVEAYNGRCNFHNKSWGLPKPWTKQATKSLQNTWAWHLSLQQALVGP